MLHGNWGPKATIASLGYVSEHNPLCSLPWDMKGPQRIHIVA